VSYYGFDYLGSFVYTCDGRTRSFESTSFGGGRIKATSSDYEVNYFITDHLGSTRVVVNENGDIQEQNNYYPFGKQWEYSSLATSTNRYRFSGKEVQTTKNLNYLDFGARMLTDEFNRTGWMSIDPLAEKYYNISPYVYCGNNPIRFIDPTGMWVADENGNLVAEKNDNAWTLAKYQNIKPQEAIAQLKEQGYTINDKGILNLKVGDMVTLDNVYTQNLASDGSLPYGSADLKYNCWGSALAGVDNKEIKVGVGIDMPSTFDNRLKSDFVSSNANEAKFGQTVIRFTVSNPYPEANYEPYVKTGEISRTPNSVGGAYHGAVYYGTSNDGTVYVYTKNGWDMAPKIMKLQDVEKMYGPVTGLGTGTGYYNKK
jgi:RHS repeat-associated protein